MLNVTYKTDGKMESSKGRSKSENAALAMKIRNCYFVYTVKICLPTSPIIILYMHWVDITRDVYYSAIEPFKNTVSTKLIQNGLRIDTLYGETTLIFLFASISLGSFLIEKNLLPSPGSKFF